MVVILGLNINIVGIVVSVDNVIDGKVYCLGDIIIMYLGKIVEIMSIDVEGCMFMVDVISYVK